jgi:hypothetical protein
VNELSLTNATKYRVWSYQLSIASGVLILFSAFSLSQWHLALTSNLTWMTGPIRLLSPNIDVLTTGLIICGIFVIIAGIAIMKWKVTKVLGIGIVIFSILSLTEMGGFFVGSILGIIGGILAFKADTGKPRIVESR